MTENPCEFCGRPKLFGNGQSCVNIYRCRDIVQKARLAAEARVADLESKLASTEARCENLAMAASSVEVVGLDHLREAAELLRSPRVRLYEQEQWADAVAEWRTRDRKPAAAPAPESKPTWEQDTAQRLREERDHYRDKKRLAEQGHASALDDIQQLTEALDLIAGTNGTESSSPRALAKMALEQLRAPRDVEPQGPNPAAPTREDGGGERSCGHHEISETGGSCQDCGVTVPKPGAADSNGGGAGDSIFNESSKAEAWEAALALLRSTGEDVPALLRAAAANVEAHGHGNHGFPAVFPKDDEADNRTAAEEHHANSSITRGTLLSALDAAIKATGGPARAGFEAMREALK